MRCVHCGSLIEFEEARFCHSCGWPLAQSCPYECGNELVQLTSNGRPTPLCPTCRRVFLVCSQAGCGRLHRAQDRECANGHGPTLVDTLDLWPNPGGSSSGITSIAGFPIPPKDRVAVCPDFGGTAIQGMVASSGHILYMTNGVLRSWDGTHEPKVAPDLGQADLGWMSLCANRTHAFYTGGGALHAIELSTMAHAKTPGRVALQTAHHDGWLGLQESEVGSWEIRKTGSQGALLCPVPREQVLGLYASKGREFLVTNGGAIYELTPTNANQVLPSRDSTIYSWFYEDFAFLLLNNGSIRAFAMDDWRLRFEWSWGQNISCPPIMVGDQGFVFHGTGECSSFHLSGAQGPASSHGYGRVMQACGVELDGQPSVIVVGEGNMSKKVACFNLNTGATREEYFSTSPQSECWFVVADGRIAVGVTGPGESRVRCYGVQ